MSGIDGRSKFKWNVTLMSEENGSTQEVEYEAYWSPNRVDYRTGERLVSDAFVALSCAAEYSHALKTKVHGVSAVLA